VVTAAPAVQAVRNGLDLVKPGGQLLIFGGVPHGSELKLDPNYLHYNEITVTGSIDATIDDFRRATALAPQLDLKRFVSHTFPLDKIDEGFKVLGRKEGIKVVIDLTK
jgi:L-iditol 2-dehydrogenase